MKYIFLTTKKAFTEASFELQNCRISLRDSLLFQIKPVPEEWAVDNLTKKAYNDVYLNKATFDDDLKSESLLRLYNLTQVFKYILDNDISKSIIIEDIHEFCKTHNNSLMSTLDIYITNHKGTDLLFLDNSYNINYSHYKSFGDSFKQNEYILKKVPAFYVNIDFIRKFLKTQNVFYKPFEYTLNDHINESQIITFFINKNISDLDDYYAYKNIVIVNNGKILMTLLSLGAALLIYKKYRK